MVVVSNINIENEVNVKLLWGICGGFESPHKSFTLRTLKRPNVY